MPFSIQQFFDVFEVYNRVTAPAAVVLSVLAGLAVMAIAWRTPWSSKVVLLILAALWLWSGGVYHLGFFTAVNPAAWAFGAAFIVQAAVFLWLAFGNSDRPTLMDKKAPKIVSAALAAYALLVYPLLNAAAGHMYPRTPSFGAPCPVTIFTFAMLIAIRGPWYAAIVPAAWTIVGSSAAIYFGISADLGLIAAAAAFLFIKTFSSPDWTQLS